MASMALGMIGAFTEQKGDGLLEPKRPCSLLGPDASRQPLRSLMLYCAFHPYHTQEWNRTAALTGARCASGSARMLHHPRDPNPKPTSSSKNSLHSLGNSFKQAKLELSALKDKCHSS